MVPSTFSRLKAARCLPVVLAALIFAGCGTHTPDQSTAYMQGTAQADSAFYLQQMQQSSDDTRINWQLLAIRALLKEGKDPEQIFVTGNTGIDALHYTVRSDFYHPETEWAKGSRLIAVTAHRRENLGEPMRDMFRAIRRIVEEFTDVKVIYPVHLNPQVRKIADEEFGGCERIHLIEPLDVVEFHNLMKASYLIMTDSGGIQEEAPALGKPVLVMRDTTERPEGVEAGTLKLAGTKMEDIYRECRRLLTEPEIYRRMSEARNKELPHD